MRRMRVKSAAESPAGPAPMMRTSQITIASISQCWRGFQRHGSIPQRSPHGVAGKRFAGPRDTVCRVMRKSKETRYEGTLAFLGGPYSNHLALRAAAEDARGRGATALFCLGDLGGFGPHPGKIYPILEEFGIRTIAGNYDQSLALRRADCGCGYTHPSDNHFAQLSYDYT